LEAVREAGVSDEAIVDALHVAFIFCLINRAASALGFSWASEADAVKGARILNRIGYKLPGFLLR
jgi:hypothetical protein